MLLFYSLEHYDANVDQWITLRVCWPPYRKTEHYEMERYGFLKLKKRRKVVDCVIHNEKRAVQIAFDEALEYAYVNRNIHSEMRISSTIRVDGKLITAVARSWG